MTTTININDLPTALQGTLVAEENRLDFWPAMHHGSIFEAMNLEGMIFDVAEKQSSDYTGGLWEFVVLDADKKIYYIYPDQTNDLTVQGIMNYSKANMSPRFFGLMTTMLCLAWRGDQTGDERYYAAYRNLHGYARTVLEEIYLPYDDVAESEWPEEVAQAANLLGTMHSFLD